VSGPATRVAAIASSWPLQLVLVVAAALILRSIFFVGFALGDDLGYLAFAGEILNGRYPPLDPLNQYAYRPLLLYLYAGGIGAFGYTDLGAVAPVLLASLATTAVVYACVWRLIDPRAAWWCAILFAFEPFNIVNSTTMTNDVVLASLVFASITVFLIGDRQASAASALGWHALAGLVMVAAFLVKITILPALAALGVYTSIAWGTRGWTVGARHAAFYLTFAAGLAAICLAYYLKTGDPLWQFRSELAYYDAYKPDWYLAGQIDYAHLMWQYPRSLWGSSGYETYLYLDHGPLFWVFLPAAVYAVARHWQNTAVRMVLMFWLIVLLFFEFYPQYLSPYLPLVRQERYLEMLIPATVIVVGIALAALFRRRPAIALAVLMLVLVDSVIEASRRSFLINDSQNDVRALARYAESTIQRTGKRLGVDVPARNSLLFYLREVPVPLVALEAKDVPAFSDGYLAVGGSRSFWWSKDLALTLAADQVPPSWVTTLEVPGKAMPWRPSPLRVYYVPPAATAGGSAAAPTAPRSP
jgi:hypothetical protein